MLGSYNCSTYTIYNTEEINILDVHIITGSRRGSIQMSLFPVRGLTRGNTLEVLDEEDIQREMEVKHMFFCC